MVTVIRADANTPMGSGHVMRCLALTQGLQDIGEQVVFAAAAMPDPLHERITSEGITVQSIAAEPGSAEDARETIAVARLHSVARIVLDGYHFAAPYQRAVKDTGMRLLVIDDNCEQDFYHADCILNPNVHAEPSLYPAEVRQPRTRLLLGPRYALLRREFLRNRPSPAAAVPAAARNILVTMGGSDPADVSSRVLAAMARVADPELRVKVVVGAGNPHHRALAEAASSLSVPTQLLRDVRDMPGLMNWADLAVSAGGGTADELMFMNVPFLAIIVAENQQRCMRRAGELGLCRVLGRQDEVSVGALAAAIARLAAARAERQQIVACQRRATAACGNLDWLRVDSAADSRRADR